MLITSKKTYNIVFLFETAMVMGVPGATQTFFEQIRLKKKYTSYTNL